MRAVDETAVHDDLHVSWMTLARRDASEVEPCASWHHQCHHEASACKVKNFWAWRGFGASGHPEFEASERAVFDILGGVALG